MPIRACNYLQFEICTTTNKLPLLVASAGERDEYLVKGAPALRRRRWRLPGQRPHEGRGAVGHCPAVGDGDVREGRRREALRMAETHYAASERTYWSSFSDRRVDAVREELQEAARASPNGFMAVAFKILRRTRPSACGNKARAPAPDLMCAIFEDGDDKDPSKLRTGADGFREELLKQGIEMYATRPSCCRNPGVLTGTPEF